MVLAEGIAQLWTMGKVSRLTGTAGTSASERDPLSDDSDPRGGVPKTARSASVQQARCASVCSASKRPERFSREITLASSLSRRRRSRSKSRRKSSSAVRRISSARRVT